METESNLYFRMVRSHLSLTCLFTHWPSACPAAFPGTYFIVISLLPFLFCAVPEAVLASSLTSITALLAPEPAQVCGRLTNGPPKMYTHNS